MFMQIQLYVFLCGALNLTTAEDRLTVIGGVVFHLRVKLSQQLFCLTSVRNVAGSEIYFEESKRL